LPLAPAPTQAPIPAGTRVALDEHATFLDRDLLSGGSPWRLLRLPGGSRVVAERWRGAGEVGAGEERFARTLLQQGLLHPVPSPRADVELVDVVIPVCDDASGLASLLAGFSGWHVTVVDDGSVDAGPVEECVRRFGASLVRLHENRGPATARNAGASATTRPLLWFLDVDVSLDDPRDVLGLLQPHFADPLLGAIAPRVRGGGGPSVRDRFELRFSPLDMGGRSGLVVAGGPIAYVPSACLLVRRDAFGEGFDESLRTGEDVDLVWRLHDRGWLVRYDADAVVAHRARATWPRWWSQRVGYGASTAELARRHGKRMAPLRVDAWTLAAWSSVLWGKPVVGARVARVAHDRLRARLASTTDEPARVAGALVGRGIIGAGGPLARAVVRTYALPLLVAALHPRMRRRALALFAVGTAWRWRTTRVRITDIPLAVGDDLAYGVGVLRGAWRSRTLGALTPHVTKSTLGLREVLGLKPRRDRRDP
jgi:mycofactocin system glycosyltransferase